MNFEYILSFKTFYQELQSAIRRKENLEKD
jgi:hypothetical protein